MATASQRRKAQFIVTKTDVLPPQDRGEKQPVTSQRVNYGRAARSRLSGLGSSKTPS
jgi:hypothetical protein